jgi:hypothetical protein
MRFYDIFWVCLAASLSIGFINSVGIFDTNYMTAPEGATYQLSDVNGTLTNTTPMDDVMLSVGMFWQALAFIKDLALNTVLVFPALVDIWGVPAPIAVILQTIVAVSWLYFLIQILMRLPLGGTES